MALDNLRILRLEAENVKKLKVVEITPTGEVVVVGGRNGQGKTSVLDSILWALGGKEPIQWKPIREGEESARIVLDLGNDDGLQLKVTRRFTAQPDGSFTTSLAVRNAEGFKPDGEQTLLNALVGALSFDPNAFIRAKPEDQVKMLKGVVKGPFEQLAAERKKAFAERTDTNRDLDRAKKSLPDPVALPDGVHSEPIDTKPILDALSSIGEQVQARAMAIGAAERMNDQAAIHFRERDRLRAYAEELRNKAAEADADADAENRKGTDCEEQASTMEIPPAPADAATLREELAAAELVNQTLEDAKAQIARLDHIAELEQAAAKLTARIAEIDKEVTDVIAKADLPVRGLSMQEDMVFLRGVPFGQASDAEQLRAALALGMAANPRLRVIRIRDGSLLDTDALQVIREVAADEGFQIWMERVGTLGDGEEIIMEDGSVKNG